MCDARLWRRLLGEDDRRVVVGDVDFDEADEVVVAHVRPRRSEKRRCSRC